MISELDFGDKAFEGDERWLAIAVRCPAGSGTYTTLNPRQLLSAVPYALGLRPGARIKGVSEVLLYLEGGNHTLVSYGKKVGVSGISTDTTGIKYGVYGLSISTAGFGVWGEALASSGNTIGVFGESNSPQGRGLAGLAVSSTGTNYGVFGRTNSSAGYAGFFDGRVHVTGNLGVGGNLGVIGTKSFKIDHPSDPANRYLYHFAQESPEVQNVYNGIIVLDEKGEGLVELPAYFSVLNTAPFRYQLTPIGAPMPNLYIAEEIEGNTFRIAGGVPGKKVSWEVTAIRNDPYLRDHPAQSEEDKPIEEQGTYLYPEGYGQPSSLGLEYLLDGEIAIPQVVQPTPSTGQGR